MSKSLDTLRDQQADFVDVQGRSLKTGDFAVVNYTGVADGKPIGELVPDAKGLGENKDFWLLISSDSFLPGFCDPARWRQRRREASGVDRFSQGLPTTTAGRQESDLFSSMLSR